jgi:hypothetical protein
MQREGVFSSIPLAWAPVDFRCVGDLISGMCSEIGADGIPDGIPDGIAVDAFVAYASSPMAVYTD